MDKEKIEEIGKYLERCLIVHRNVENDTKWTTEEKMIQQLYDSYLDLKIENKILNNKISELENFKYNAPSKINKTTTVIHNEGIGDVVEENKRLNNIIDKAIEYITQLEHSEWITFGRKILFDILKDSDK